MRRTSEGGLVVLNAKVYLDLSMMCGRCVCTGEMRRW